MKLSRKIASDRPWSRPYSMSADRNAKENVGYAEPYPRTQFQGWKYVRSEPCSFSPIDDSQPNGRLVS